MTLFDSHAHLSMLDGQVMGDFVARARAVSVDRMVTVSTDPENWEKNQKFAESDPHIYYSLGLHPHEAKDWPTCKDTLEKLFPNSTVPNKCVAIGEIGLDYHYNHSTPEQQKKALEEQLLLAKKVGLPVIIHCRDAFDDFFACLEKVGGLAHGGVMHCFTGTTAEAHASLKRGFYISFSGIVTFKKSQPLRDTAKEVPLDRLLIETDCPFLTPDPHRGKTNEPFYLPFTAETLALTKGISTEAIAEATTANALRLFRL